MAEHEQIEQLQRRLKREAPGPLLDLTNQMTVSLLSMLRGAVQWVSEAAEERPLISVLLALEAGFVVARLGRAHAKH